MYSSVEGRRTTGSFFDFLVSPIMFFFFTSAGVPLAALDIFSRKISKSAITWLKISYREEEEEEQGSEKVRQDPRLSSGLQGDCDQWMLPPTDRVHLNVDFLFRGVDLRPGLGRDAVWPRHWRRVDV